MRNARKIADTGGLVSSAIRHLYCFPELSSSAGCQHPRVQESLPKSCAGGPRGAPPQERDGGRSFSAGSKQEDWMGSKCALQSRAPPTAAGPGLRRAGASAPHAGPCRPGGVGAQDCIPAGRRTSHPCQTSVPVLGSREWPGWRRGGSTGSFRGREHRRRDAHLGPVSVGLSPWLTASILTVFRAGPRAWGEPTRGAGRVCARHRLRLRASPSARTAVRVQAARSLLVHLLVSLLLCPTAVPALTPLPSSS